VSKKKAISRREFLKQAGMGVAAAAAANILASCAPKPTPTPQPTKVPPTKVPPTAVPPTPVPPTPKPVEKATVVWWTEAGPTSLQTAVEDLFVKPFNDSHPNIKLQMEWVAQLSDKITTAVAGGGGPDIIEVGAPQVIDQLYDAGYVYELGAFADQYKWREILAPWAVSAGTYKGKFMSVQLTQGTEMLVYNRAMAQAKGWKVPREADEVEALAKKCLAEGIVPFAHHNAWPVYHSALWNNYSSALSVYKWLTGQIPFTSPEFVGACDYMKMMADKGWMGPDVWDMGWGSEWALMTSNKAFMKIDMETVFKTGAEAFGQFDWDTAQIPNLRAGITNTWQIGSGEALAVAKTCKYPEAAAEVFNFIYSDRKRAGQLMAAVPGEWLPPIRLTMDDIPSTLDPRQKQTIVWINEAAMENKIGYVTWTWWPLPTLSVTMDLGGQHMTGELSSKDFCAKVQAQFEIDRAAGMVRDIPKTYGA